MQERDVIISVESFFDQSPSTEYIQALEDTEVFYISYQELQWIYHTYLEFNFVRGVLTEYYYKQSMQRIRSLRMHRAFEKYQSLLESTPGLLQRVPSKYIASYLGISEETLSRIRSGKKY